MSTAGPLAGKVVLVTRPRDQAGELSDRLRERGAVPVEAPTIRVEPVEPGGPLDGTIQEASRGVYEWVVFTSGFGVDVWTGRAEALGIDGVRAKVAAVGTGTAEALGRRGLRPDLVPDPFTTEALGTSFPTGSGRVLLARADIAAPELEEVIAAKGWEPVRVDAYRNVPAESIPDEAHRVLEDGTVDAVTFTSASTVEGFVRLVGTVEGPAVVCIGPVTAEAAHRAGFAVRAVARPHTIEGLVAALERVFT